MGKAIFCCITQLGRIQADYKYIITRGNFSGFKGVPYLKVFSPSDELHQNLLNLKSNEELFLTTLLTEFPKEKKKDPVYQYTKAQFIQKIKQGKTFCFACCCPESNKCHRSLVAKDFAEGGVEVELL